MKEIAALILLSVSFMMLSACGEPAQSTSLQNSHPESTDYEKASNFGNESAADSSRTADNTDSTFTENGVKVLVTMPEGWDDVSGSVLSVQYLKGTASFLVKEENFTGTNLDDVVKEAEALYAQSFDEYEKVGETEPETIDGKDARRLTFTCSISGMKMEYTYIYLYAADRLYVLTFADLAESFSKTETDIRQVMEHIRFIT